MQIKSLRLKSYRSWRINDNSSAEAMQRLKKLELFDKLVRQGALTVEAIN